MMTSRLLLSALLLTGVTLLAHGKPALPEDKDQAPLVEEINLPGVQLGIKGGGRGMVTKPLLVKDVEELAKLLPDEKAREQVANKVNWKQQHLLVFRWAGSGMDRLSARTEGEKITFVYQPGRTRDLRPHLKVFAIRQGAKWEIQKSFGG